MGQRMVEGIQFEIFADLVAVVQSDVGFLIIIQLIRVLIKNVQENLMVVSNDNFAFLRLKMFFPPVSSRVLGPLIS
jgi:hypothetical protein